LALRWCLIAACLVVPSPALAQAQVPQGSPPLPTPRPATKPFPFSFTLNGFISAMGYLQDASFYPGNGNEAITSPTKVNKWFLGGDVRQTELKFVVRGPEVLGGIPTGVVEVDFLGGNAIKSVPAQSTANPVTTTPMGDESVLPELRLAYVDLDWGAGTDLLRVGQFHNLLIPMIPASASHIGVPLGYGAGAIGWRAPGVTYFHGFAFSKEMKLDIGLQVNENSWIDSEPVCTAVELPGPAPMGTDCLPAGISMGEASGLPQVEARVLLASGKSDSPWPYYPANDWQVYLVGHWDEKVISGVGPPLPAPIHDNLQTYVGELGFKVQIAPVIVAGNGWYGLNSGGLFGNELQMQLPTVAAAGHDVSGFGAWGQIGISLTRELSLWGFYGIDQPNADEAKAAGFTRLRNMHMAGMLAYKDGPYAIAVEFLHVLTDSLVSSTMTAPARTVSIDGNQPSASAIYFF
jgi:hypothetical protein